MKIAILILFFFLSCVTADKDNQSVNLNKNMANMSNANYEAYINLPYDDYEISILNLEPSGNLFKIILANFIVDNEGAALSHLTASYFISMVTIKNKTEKQIKISETSFHYKYKENVLKPLRKTAQYPTSIDCINWKGNVKNLYNTAVVTGMSAFVVAAVIACAKEGKCEALRQTDNVAKVATSGETDPNKTFSDIIFESKLKYADIIELDKPLIFEPNEIKEGILIYPKPVDFTDKNRALHIPNCVVY